MGDNGGVRNAVGRTKRRRTRGRRGKEGEGKRSKRQLVSERVKEEEEGGM